MTVTLKKLRETIKAFLDKVMDDIKLIAVQEHKDEILYEYKQTLNVSAAITSVTERYKAIEAERARAETEQLERKKAELNEQINIKEYEPFTANVPTEVAAPLEEEQPARADEKYIRLALRFTEQKHSLKTLLWR